MNVSGRETLKYEVFVHLGASVENIRKCKNRCKLALVNTFAMSFNELQRLVRLMQFARKRAFFNVSGPEKLKYEVFVRFANVTPIASYCFSKAQNLCKSVIYDVFAEVLA